MSLATFIYVYCNTEFMRKIPCEYIVWNVLPSIRKEFTKSLMKNYGINQKQVAKILKITPSAVSQYLTKKRGGIDITDDNVIREIDKSAKIILEKGSSRLVTETCRICNLLKSDEEILIKKGYNKKESFW